MSGHSTTNTIVTAARSIAHQKLALTLHCKQSKATVMIAAALAPGTGDRAPPGDLAPNFRDPGTSSGTRFTNLGLCSKSAALGALPRLLFALHFRPLAML